MSYTAPCTRVLCLVAILSTFAVPLIAQGERASIVGTVSDEQGGLLSDCAVTLHNQDTGFARSIVTDADGRFQFVALAIGRYQVTAECNGFAPRNATDLVLTIGLELRHDFTMTLRPIQEHITVAGQTRVVDVTKSEVAGVVTQDQIQQLPSNSRQYLNLALLMPGTSQDAARAFYNNVTIAAGATFYSNAFLVDGMSNTWAEQGEPRQNYPQGAVQEFKVNTVGSSAEFGLAVGGVVQVVTKSGSNRFHGDAFEYFRDKSLNALNTFEEQQHDLTGAPKPGFQRNQFGGSVGGPIVLNRTHFFAAFERTVTDNFYTTATGRPDLYSALEGTYRAPAHANLYDLRIDHQLNDSQNLFIRYAHEDQLTTCNGCGGVAARNTGFDFGKPARSLVAGHTWSISSKLLNDIRFQFGYAMFQVFPAGGQSFTDVGSYPPERVGKQRNQVVLIFPSLTYGSNADELGLEKRWQFKDSVTFNRASHQVKFGVDASYISFIDDAASNVNGTYVFAQDQFFNPNDPRTIANLKNPVLFVATVPPVNNSIPTTHFATFVQDDWRLRPNLSLNIGLRYDRQFGSFNETLDPNSFSRPIPFIDPSIRGDKNNLGPRIGLVWDASNNGEFVIRTGYGIYYDNVRTLNNVYERRNLSQFNVFITNPSYPDPYGGKDPVTFASTQPPNLVIFANNFRNASAQQVNLGFSRQLTSDLSLHVDGAYVRTDGDGILVDVNLPNAAGVRPLPEWGAIRQAQSIVWSHYRALYMRLDKRLSHRTQFLISYTLAHQTDFSASGGRGSGQVTDQSNYALDYGDADVDRRHTIVASGTVLLPYGLNLGAVWTYRSTLPFSAFSGTFGVDGQRLYVPGTTRNEGARDLDVDLVNAYRAHNGLAPIPASHIQRSDFDSLDIRASKSFALSTGATLELIAQVFNVLGRDNLNASGRVVNALSNSFGQIQSAGPRQQAELAVRLAW